MINEYEENIIKSKEENEGIRMKLKVQRD